ncbi:TnpV protein, partial [Bacteroides caecimuris]|uniref:TnpV protein n=1 Tax=Bacteroides caecimuris TaxID=1796613 RepID=UPI00257473AE
YLKEHRPALYNALLLSGKLNSYLADIDQRAQELFDTIIQHMAYVQSVTEMLKAADQMAWVGSMNNIRKVAEEIVCKELILR